VGYLSTLHTGMQGVAMGAYSQGRPPETLSQRSNSTIEKKEASIGKLDGGLFGHHGFGE